MHRVTCLSFFLFVSGAVNAGDDGFQPLFNGKDLSGWTRAKEQKGHWKIEDGVLVFDGKSSNSRLSTKKTFGDFDLAFEWMPSGNTKRTNLRYRYLNPDEPFVMASGLVALFPGDPRGMVKISTPPTAQEERETVALAAGKWNKVNVRIASNRVSVSINGKAAIDRVGFPELKGGPGTISFDGEGPMRIRNIFIRELKDGK